MRTKCSILCIVFLTALACAGSAEAQERVANYTAGRAGTARFEALGFWVRDGQPSGITYTFGSPAEVIELKYVGIEGWRKWPAFKVKFQNGRTLYVVPQGLTLRVTDDAKYSKVFRWQYEGPVGGRGTACVPCAADAREAMQLIKAHFLNLRP